MEFNEILIQSFESLKSNKLRSFLTMLGIVMGVFSIIAIIAVGNAVQEYVNSQFEKVGANIIFIKEKSNTVNENDWLTLDDIETIKKAVPEVKNIDAYTQIMSGTLRVGSKTRDAVIIGVMEQTRSFSAIDMKAGRFITAMDEKLRTEVCVVEEAFMKKYFGRSDAIGSKIILKNASGQTMKASIVGVIKSEGSFFEEIFGESAPVTVYLPITTAQAFTGTKKLQQINVAVAEKDKLQEIGVRIVKALEFKRGNKDKYMAMNSADIQKQASNVLGMIQLGLLVIAIITLIVGGIGIVNIMLVSVTERIREIGIRKALGAQKRDIIVQFLAEAMIMTGISGVIGIVIGLIIGGIISAIIKIPPVVDLVVVFGSLLFSLALGVVFGVYPAKRAADLDPVEALRYE